MDLSYRELVSNRFEHLITPIKLCLSIKILNELKLLEINARDGRFSCSVCKNGAKTELDKSPLFRLLWGLAGS